jgi:hypothetical protein
MIMENLNGLLDRLDALERSIDKRLSAIEATQSERIAHLEQELIATGREIVRLRLENALLLRSTSWRITAPLRRLTRRGKEQ